MKKSNKRLLLKLGGMCNLHCRHCHCAPSVYPLKEEIFPYMEKENFRRVTFSGGEPLLYMDTIKKVVERMPAGTEYKIVTNGTLLTQDLVDYFNDHNFLIIFSYDGENGSRDDTYLQCWHELARIKNHGLATLFSQDTRDAVKLFNDVLAIRQKYGLHWQMSSVWANFVHQTVHNDENIGRELAKEYCLFLAGQLEIDMRKFKADPKRKDLGVMMTAFNHWIKKYSGRGIKCFNEELTVMTTDGRFLLCPYDTVTVGDIHTGIDWEKIESHIPERCRGCSLWESCGNVCIANVTDNECFISKVMHKHFYRLMHKYGLTYGEIEEAFSN